jgi:uncharacterized glyoxalase superfamily protein PhnB
MNPNRVRPKLVLADAAAALDFYARVLGASEIARYDVEGRSGLISRFARRRVA